MKKVAERVGVPWPERSGHAPRQGTRPTTTVDGTRGHFAAQCRLRGVATTAGIDVFAPRYNIAPTQAVVVVGDDGKRRGRNGNGRSFDKLRMTE